MLIEIFEKIFSIENHIVDILLEKLTKKTTSSEWIYVGPTKEGGYKAYRFKDRKRKFNFEEFMYIDKVIHTKNACRSSLTIVMSPKTEEYIYTM